jgi:hypothetical protein
MLFAVSPAELTPVEPNAPRGRPRVQRAERRQVIMRAQALAALHRRYRMALGMTGSADVLDIPSTGIESIKSKERD